MTLTEKERKGVLEARFNNLDLKSVEDAELRRRLSRDSGLYGKVYIRASHFPGLFNGKWDDEINKKCASCMYLIAKGTPFDRFLGMEVVDSVKDIPWKKSYLSLKPKFEACGIEKAAGSNYKEKIKSLFSQMSRQPESSATQSWFPSHDSTRSLKKASPVVEQVETKDREAVKGQKRLERIASQLVSQNFLSVSKVEEVLATNKSAAEKVLKLYRLASNPAESAQYEGRGTDLSYHDMNHRDLKASDHNVPTKEARDLKARNQTSLNKVSKLIKANLVTIGEVEAVTKGKKSPEAKLASVLDYISKKSNSRDFQGEIKTANIPAKRKKSLGKVENKKVKEGRKIEANLQSYISAGILHEETLSKISSLSETARYKHFMTLYYRAKI